MTDTKPNDGGPAFPFGITNGTHVDCGMSLRAYIATVPGGNAWDKVADPDAVIAEMREQPKQSAEPTDTEMLEWMEKC